MACPSAGAHEVFDSAAFSLLPAVNHKQQPSLGAITCTCQHVSTIPCCAVTGSPRLNLSLLILHSRSSSSFLHLIFRLLPECVMVHGEAEGYGFDRWATQSVTRHLLNIWRREVTGADVPTLEAVPFKWYRRANSIAS